MSSSALPPSVVLYVFALAVPAAGCIDTGVDAPQEIGSADTAPLDSELDVDDTGASWDVRPPVEEGAQVTFVARCALLEEPRQITWTLVDADAHIWEIDRSVTDPGVPAAWIPSACYVRLGSQGELVWEDDGHISYDVIHDARPSLRAGAWLGVVHLEQVELSDACRQVYAEHGASLPALELVRIPAP